MPETLIVAFAGAVIIVVGLGGLLTVQLLRRVHADHAHSQALLRKLTQAVEQSPSTVMITDLDGTIEYVNPKFTTLTGYTPDEVIGQNPRIQNSGLTPDEVYRELWATITAGGEWRGEFRNRKKNGVLYWEFASISPVRDAQGRNTHYVAVKEDITARKEAEAALRESEAKSDAILSAIPGFVFRLNREGVYLDVRGSSERALQVVDEAPEQAVGKRLHDLLPSDKADLLLAAIQHTLDTAEMQIVEYVLHTLSGPVNFEARMVQVGPDEVLSAVRDVTARRKLEAALRESEEKYRNVSERANDGIVIVQEGVVQYCNALLARMIGVAAAADMTGRSFGDMLAPDVRDTVLGYYKNRIAGKTAPTRFETRLLHAR
ncbi:MAG: PAS domain S-box protein, partial [Anaerolineae bacterium]|nr:PAS domain S-box protein [Anaerolineae bacterium]